MPQRSSDYQLGQLYAERLASRRPIEPSMALNILQDLMGADVSLLPSIRLLASQPTFFQLINAKPSEVLLPQRDALLTAAQEILAPALVKRITNFFDGYLNSGSDQSETPPFSEPQTQLKEDSPKGSSFPPVLGREAYELPKTVVAESNRSSDAQSTSKQISSPRASFPSVLSKTPDELAPTLIEESSADSSSSITGFAHPAQRGGSRQSLTVVVLSLTVLVAVAAAAVFAVLKVPAICEPLGFCPVEESDENPQKDVQAPTAPSDKEVDKLPTPTPTNSIPLVPPDREESLW